MEKELIKLCECGCGQPTKIFIGHLSKKSGHINGKPNRFILGHAVRKRYEKLKESRQFPDQLCKCGCGQITPRAVQTHKRDNVVKGKPLEYIHGHQLIGKPSPRKGIKVSAETLQKMSLAMKGKLRPNFSGVNSSAWKGGVSTENEKLRKSIYFKNWRESIFERDNYSCKCCNKRGGQLHPHHIKSWSDFEAIRFEISNGITLCKECHNKFHNEYGKKQYNEEKLNIFLIDNGKID